MAQTSKCGPGFVLFFLIATLAHSAMPACARAASVPAIFSSERFAAVLTDNPYVWETARRLIQKPSADFNPSTEPKGDCRSLLTSENLDFQDFFAALKRNVEAGGPAAAFVAEWARRLQAAIDAGSSTSMNPLLTIDINAGSGLIVFKEPRFIYRVSTQTLWFGWADESQQQELRTIAKIQPPLLSWQDAKSGTNVEPAALVKFKAFSAEFKTKRELFSKDLEGIEFIVGQMQIRPMRTPDQVARSFKQLAKRFDSALKHLEPAVSSAQNGDERAEAKTLSDLLSAYFSKKLKPQTLIQSLEEPDKTAVLLDLETFNHNIDRLQTIQRVIADWETP